MTLEIENLVICNSIDSSCPENCNHKEAHELIGNMTFGFCNKPSKCYRCGEIKFVHCVNYYYKRTNNA